MIDDHNFDQPVKNDIRTYNNVGKIAVCQEDYYSAGCLLDCVYIKENFKLITIDLSKQQTPNADPKVILN